MGVHAMTRSARSGEGPSMALTLDGVRVSETEMERPSPRVRRLKRTEEALSLRKGEPRKLVAQLERQSGPPILLNLRAHYEVPLTPETRAPQSNGFTIQRRYETLDGASLEGTEETTIPLGSLVRVRVRVESEAQRNYVAIADELPAGLEPLNARLDTTESVASSNLGPDVARSLPFLSHSEMRDERVAFYVDDMPPGAYEFAYVARATTSGVFLRPAADVEAMYEPDLRATTRIDEVRVR
jgi:alpha-2-macroglobulin